MENGTPTFFDGVPPDELEHVLGGLERRQFPAGAVVIAEGDQPNELYITQSGRAEVLVSDRRGGTQRAVGRIRPGSTLGEMSLFTGQPAVGTVRATSDLEVLVMSGIEFERFANSHPNIYRNLGAILSERLARTNRLAVKERQGGLTVLNNLGAPPLVAYALTASVAWHTRAPALLLVVSDDPPAELTALGTTAGAQEAPRAEVSVVESLDTARGQSLAGRIDDLFHRYENVLVLLPPGSPAPELKTARTVDLAPPAMKMPERDGAASVRTVRAWSTAAPAAYPGRSGVTHVPELGSADETALRDGLLPTGTPAGTAIGWLARDLAGLKVGVALGAGSLRGYAHVGVLDALGRAGVPIDYICGTSVGSAVAAMYAIGLDSAGRARALDGAGAAMFRPTVPVRSFLSTRALGRFIEALGQGKRIEELNVPLALVAADLLTKREVVFRRGELWLAVVASCSIPGIFPAQPVGPYMLVDGGVLNPVPASVAEAMGADTVIAVRLGSLASPAETDVEASLATRTRPTVFSVTMRSIEIMQSRIATETGDATTITITPDLRELAGAKLRNFSSGRAYIEDGAAAAEEALPRIAAALPWIRS